MNEYPQEDIELEPKKRPVLLTVLVILSLLTISDGIISNLLGLSFGPLSPDQIQKIVDTNMEQAAPLYEMGQVYWGDVIVKVMNMVRYTNANFVMDRMISLLGYGIGLFGVLKMLSGFKIGFHFYIIYNLILIFGVYASVPISEIPGFYFAVYGFISLFFISLYSKTLWWMTK